MAGSIGPYEGVVVARNIPEDIKGDDLHRVNAFEQGLTEGLTSRDVPVVGVEHVDTDPTQVPWYRDNGLSIGRQPRPDRRAGGAGVPAGGNTDGAFGVHQPRLLPDIVGGAVGLTGVDLTRRRELGQLVEDTWRLFNANLGLFLTIALVIVVPVDLLVLGVGSGSCGSTTIEPAACRRPRWRRAAPARDPATGHGGAASPR